MSGAAGSGPSARTQAGLLAQRWRPAARAGTGVDALNGSPSHLSGLLAEIASTVAKKWRVRLGARPVIESQLRGQPQSGPGGRGRLARGGWNKALVQTATGGAALAFPFHLALQIVRREPVACVKERTVE